MTSVPFIPIQGNEAASGGKAIDKRFHTCYKFREDTEFIACETGLRMGGGQRVKKIFGAVDIGGTKIMTGLVEESGTVLSSRSFPTPLGDLGAEKGTDEIVRSLLLQCQEVHLPPQNISGVGIVSAGPVDCKNGRIENPYTLPGWAGYPLTAAIESRLGCVCKLDNDANGMLMGEVNIKKLQGKHVLLLAVGTGIGVASFGQDQVYRANGRYHPEMGHVIVSGDGPACYCGHPGCFESLCSGPALHRYAQSHGYVGFEQLYTQWRGHDPQAAEWMKPVSHWIRNGVFSLMLVFKPDELIIGGGFGQHFFDYFKSLIEEDLSGHSDFFVDFRVQCAESNGASALVGAAMLASQ